MSIELRVENDEVVCDWGNFVHSNPRPDLGEVGPLMLATTEYVQRLADGPLPYNGAVHSVTEKGARTFACIDYYGKRWRWELHDAHWWDGEGPAIFVGRWPD